MARLNRRADHVGQHRTAYDKARAKLLKAGGCCGICGQPIDTTIKDPLDPMAATVDHIIPISKGGHPSDMANLQLAHRWCNRQKSNKLIAGKKKAVEVVERNDNLPLHFDWIGYANSL